MPYGMTNSEALALHNYRLRGSAYSQVTGGTIGLFTVAPFKGNAGTEVSGGGYARQAVTWSAATDPALGSSNSGALTFPQATADWGTIVAWGRFDGSGILRDVGLFDNSFPVLTGATLVIPAGALTIALDGGL